MDVIREFLATPLGHDLLGIAIILNVVICGMSLLILFVVDYWSGR